MLAAVQAGLTALQPVMMSSTASPLFSAALVGCEDAVSVGDGGTRELLVHPCWGTATAQEGTPTQYLISHEPLLVDGYKVIYFVISLILLSKPDLVSKLYSFLHFH